MVVKGHPGGPSVASQGAKAGGGRLGRVGVDTAVGLVTGGLGAGTGAMVAWKTGQATLSTRVAAAAAGGAVEGGAGNVASYAMGPGPHTVEGYVQATAVGTVTGGVTAGVTGYQPKWLNLETMRNFKWGIYRSGYLRGGTILHRAGDINQSVGGQHMGKYWSTDAPTSITQVREEKAIPPVWPRSGDPAPLTHGFSARFRDRTPAYSGLVAPQKGSAGEIYSGGTGQTYIPNAWNYGSEVAQWPLLP